MAVGALSQDLGGAQFVPPGDPNFLLKVLFQVCTTAPKRVSPTGEAVSSLDYSDLTLKSIESARKAPSEASGSERILEKELY